MTPTPDLRALVRARMLDLGIKQAALAARLAPRWGCSVDSAVRRLSRWQTHAADITSDPLADVLAELGGSLAWDAAALPPAQAAYALALANYAAAECSAEEAKIAAGIDYTTCETDAAIDEMSEREGAINDAHGISALRDALTDAELALVAWGIGRACELAALNEIPVLRDLERRAVANVVARAKVVAACLKLAA